jgi:CBS domain-containing protein
MKVVRAPKSEECQKQCRGSRWPQVAVTAADIMSRDLITASPLDNLEKAEELLYQNGIRHLPIVKDGQLVGIVSDRDLQRIMPTSLERLNDPDRSRRSLEAPLRDIYHTDFVAVEPTTELNEIIEVIVEERLGAVPVIEPHNARLVGIVSYIDVLRKVGEFIGD